ncbi:MULTISPECIES: hypothetical protein [unclassified Polaribacter]|uniref:hypothetical protein n=1 Tax=unclassified Polaribacter TaxID=196858 RepID=UPI0011BEA78A|nr:MULTISPECIES: hypothetical protein [unclassified Polaribacter]TXD54370.1 hypothetical protein ES043_00525 [Polaribacter sp. IC063]TXD62799.1 hypothetical protein ES044_00235 [Polaribacter sp. IC066]
MKNQLNTLLALKLWIFFLSITILSVFSETIIRMILIIIWLLLCTYWTLKVGEKLHNKLTNKSTLNLKRFKAQILFVVNYLVIVSVSGGDTKLTPKILLTIARKLG